MTATVYKVTASNAHEGNLLSHAETGDLMKATLDNKKRHKRRRAL